MARIDLSSAGVKVKYAVEATAGTRPTASYTAITGIKSIPDLNPEPGTLETTTLDETEWKTFIPSLRDVGGSLAFTANNTEQLHTEWSALCEASKTAKEGGKLTWFVIEVPGLSKSFFFAGEPTELGLGAVEVDSVLQLDCYISPSEIAGWQTKLS